MRWWVEFVRRVMFIFAVLLLGALPAATSTAMPRASSASPSVSSASPPLFSEGFESGLSRWSGSPTKPTTGVVVSDPVRAGNKVLAFTALSAGGDLFSPAIPVAKGKTYSLTFDYLGKPGTGGGIVGISIGTPSNHRWLVGTQQKGAGEANPLVDDGKWHSYTFNFVPGGHTWYSPDGARAVKLAAISAIHIMIEDNWGTPGDAYFDNVKLSQCTCYAGPVKIDISFHAQSLGTAPPLDGGRCPGSSLKAARVLGKIEAQITPDGAFQGGGYEDDTPRLAACRVPRIKFAVDKIEVTVVDPGKVMQATLTVHIDAEGVHRPGQCKVGTSGVIVATYDSTSMAANSLQNDRLKIGPWSSACDAHNHTITNNIS